LSEDTLQKAVSATIKAGYQLDKGTFDFLKTLPETVDLEALMAKVIEEMKGLPERPLFVDLMLVETEAEKTLREAREKEKPTPSSSSETEALSQTLFQPYAKGVEPDLEVLEDTTDKLHTTGVLEDYVDYFQDRFKRMRGLLRQRMDARDAISVSEALKASNRTKTKIICIITDKRETKSGIFLTVEDLENSATVYVSLERKSPTVDKVRAVLLDQVVCITVLKGKGNLLIAEDLTLPDIPGRKPNRAPIPIHAALISDLHVGSKMFMEKEFRRFLLWLKGEFGDERSKTLAGYVKYVIIAGDLVDGVGIYPQQIDELSIKDVYKQYESLAQILESIPDYIEVVVIPGNHDASRRALPQPAIPKKYAESLYAGGRVHSLSNPSTISLHGVNLLLYHGRSLDDVVSLVPNMSFQEPDKSMKFLLQSRHLAPTYGQRTPIASEKRDYLIIEQPPDIFHAGHVHLMKYNTYRGVHLINSGAWQGQTEYQREMGHVPNPGLVPIVNLQTLEITPMDFRTA